MALHHHSRAEEWTPFGRFPLADRNPNEAAFDLGGSSASLRFLSAAPSGLVAPVHAQNSSERKSAWAAEKFSLRSTK